MKLFGKDLFSFKGEPKFMYDFAQHGLLNISTLTYYVTEAVPAPAQGGRQKKQKPVVRITPKGLFELKALNSNDFKIITDEDYLDKNIEAIKAKLDFLGKAPKEKKRSQFDAPTPMEMGAVRYGREELESVLERLNNRRQLKNWTTLLNKYPHTSSQLVADVLKSNTHLRAKKAEAFVPDFPADAVAAMKEYDNMCLALCNKKAIFYVIAMSEDFQTVSVRRDPILLAQSPFGHFWQILGAWDKEMMYLGDL